ncbi:MAG: hypothetical protein C4332_15575 [Meiothermus sp.]
MDVLIAVLVVALAVWFLYRVIRGLIPGRFARATPRRVTEKCPVCRDVLNPAEVTALRQGRRKCMEMARCPYQRGRWVN